ncbi:hypothetical protein BC828DRAFT_278906 [Blastocladiella britannica]|nr:hypothetical protein BC828DRAFT_278906 [Blastocladiella britannica]
MKKKNSDKTVELTMDASFSCPFCAHDVPVAWADITLQMFDLMFSYLPELVQQQSAHLRTHPLERATLIVKYRNDPLLFKNLTSKLPEQRVLCLEHHRRSIMVEAEKNDWPPKEDIHLDTLDRRVRGLASLMDDIIEDPTHHPAGASITAAFTTMAAVGSLAYRNSTALQARMLAARPGYYGPQGARIIAQALAELYIHDPVGALGPDELGHFRPFEYVSELLCPVAVRLLVHQDMRDRRMANGAGVGDGTEDWEAVDALVRDTAEYGDILFSL